jgi:hypothetical protein
MATLTQMAPFRAMVWEMKAQPFPIHKPQRVQKTSS